MVKNVDFVGGEVRGVRAEDLEDLVACGRVNLEVELRLGVAQLLPGLADLARLLLGGPFGRSAQDDGGRFEALRGTEDAVPEIICGNDREADALAALFGQG